MSGASVRGSARVAAGAIAVVCCLAGALAPATASADVGDLTYQDCFSADADVDGNNNCTLATVTSGALGANTGLMGISDLAISPDGKSLFGVSYFDSSLLRFSRNTSTGSISFDTCFAASSGVGTSNGCVQADDPAVGAADTGFDSLTGVAIDPFGGNSLYTASATDAAVGRFDLSGVGAATYDSCLTADLFVTNGTNDCTQLSQAGGDGSNSGLQGLEEVTVSPDGKSVYVAAADDAAVFRFDRATSGALTQMGCITADLSVVGDNGCVGVDDTASNGIDTGFEKLGSVDVSRDGTSLYATAVFDSAILHFSRSPSGAISYVSCFTGRIEPVGENGCVGASSTANDNGLTGLSAARVSPDGKSVYAVGSADASIIRFDRNTTSGALTYAGCITADGDVLGQNSCTDLPNLGTDGANTGLDTPRSLAIAPDGATVYVSTENDASIVSFDRDKGDGSLAFAGCITADSDVGSNCTDAPDPSSNADDTGWRDLAGLVVSKDGRSLYAVSRDEAAVLRFDREPSPACSDLADNDGDGKTDFPADPGCTSAADDDETDPFQPPPDPACSDGADNDGDGKTDFPADPGCTSAADDDETDPVEGPTDKTAPSLRLSGKKKQRSTKKLVVKATVDEDAEVKLKQKGKKVKVKGRGATGAAKAKLKLKPKGKSLKAGETKKLKLKPKGKKAKRQLKRLLRKGKRVTFKLKGTAIDGAGNTGKDSVKVTLRK